MLGRRLHLRQNRLHLHQGGQMLGSRSIGGAGRRIPTGGRGTIGSAGDIIIPTAAVATGNGQAGAAVVSRDGSCAPDGGWVTL